MLNLHNYMVDPAIRPAVSVQAGHDSCKCFVADHRCSEVKHTGDHAGISYVRPTAVVPNGLSENKNGSRQ